MIDFTQEAAIERLAELVAERVIRKISRQQSQVLVSREELAELTNLGIRTIDRMAKGGSWERDAVSREKVWRESDVKLEPIRRGGRVLFDKASSIAAIKAVKS